ncbi:hypothetical protein CWE22_11535 [Pseudidiomarina aestuarii]|uniref:Uncharacterized protein n=1 Tax=Pseudidiomarina aestuarii TaxID=624146 RepID=A0A7Z7ESJ6_9GAMM|nr:LapA family protein [Pseudidiomarina aestuarii]RUO38043.1 hypothetical protein CWE22_11535 [Pseudidiomarina aestuarii]
MKASRKIPDLATLTRRMQWVVIAGTLAIGALVGYLAGNWHVFVLQDQVAQLEKQVDSLYERAEVFDYQQHMASVELGIEKAATQSLQQELLSAQDENFALRRELTFYQKIMAPEMEASGVVIDSFELQPNRTEGHFHFRLAVVQMERQRSLTKGSVAIRLSGRSEAGNAQSFDLHALANLTDSDKQFSMRYFTVQAGDFVLPENFLPERIDVEVTVSSGSNQQLSKSFYWNQLLKPAESPTDSSSPENEAELPVDNT